MFAQSNIKEGTIVLKASDHPDLELAPDPNPTCAVTELDNGDVVLVAVRDIQQGEWFSIAEDSDDNNDDDQDV